VRLVEVEARLNRETPSGGVTGTVDGHAVVMAGKNEPIGP